MNAPLPFSPIEVCNDLLSLRLDPRKDNDYTNCPFCGGKKKLNIVLWGEKAHLAHCAKCGWSGNTISLYREVSGSSTPYKDILEKIGVENRESVFSYKEEKTQTSPLAPIKARHEINKRLLYSLPLEQEDTDNLLKRGLPIDIILRNGYRTYYVPDVNSSLLIVKTIKENAKADCCDELVFNGVPPFCTFNQKWGVALCKRKGFLIPYRNRHAQIQGFQHRRRGETDLYEEKNGECWKVPRYKWLTSRGYDNGTKSPCFVHYATEFCYNKDNRTWNAVIGDTLYITEGALKGDVFHTLTGLPVLCVAGVNSISLLGTELEALKRKVKNVVCAYDMDYIKKKEVVEATKKLENLVKSFGFQYYRLLWDDNYKGIDDFVFANRKFKIVFDGSDENLKCIPCEKKDLL